MSYTHGGKHIHFEWGLENDLLTIVNENGRIHKYHLDEIIKIIQWLKEEFGDNWFPLANNVAKLGDGTEKNGLGVAILEQAPGDITHAQGASYLGVVLEQVGIFKWNGASRGIEWRFERKVNEREELRKLLSSR